MLRECLTTRLINVVLIVGLLFVSTPAGPVAAKPVTNLAVDVWMDKGGQGQGTPGGQYNLGEEPVIFFSVSIGCQARITLSGPGGTNAWDVQAMYGPVYQMTLGVTEAADIGQWHVVLDAETSTGDQAASDMTSFVVVAPEPATTLPESSPSWILSPAPQPEASPGSSSTPETTVAESVPISPKLATVVDALVAMKMANGSSPVDLNLDATDDGKITPEDARSILRWAVNSQSFFGMAFDPERLQVTGQGEDGPATWVYTFPRQEVARDVFLDKTMALEKTSSGYEQRITLEFENTSDTEIEYWHTEVIPKSFAAHVDDIRFSRQPDRIIDPDPCVAFGVIVTALAGVAIALAVDTAGTCEYVQSSVEAGAGAIGGLVSRPYMKPSRFDALSAEEQCTFIKEALEAHLGDIQSSAQRNNVPPSLLALTILNELIAYGPVDQAQEHIANLGSSGMAQLQIERAIDHYLVDVTEEEIDNHIQARFALNNAVDASLDHLTVAMLSETNRMRTRQYLVWEKLNQDKDAVEAAAREISYQLDRMNENQDKSWGSFFLEGPIDRSDIYANIKVRAPRETDPEKIRLMQKKALALMVGGIYNTPDLAKTVKPMTADPYSGNFDGGETFKNGVNHGHWAALFVEALERCLPIDDKEAPQPQVGLRGVNECLLSIRCKLCGRDRETGDLRCEDEPSTFLCKGSVSEYESGYRFVGSQTTEGSHGAIVTKVTVMLDAACSRVTSFEASTTGMDGEGLVTVVVAGRDLGSSPEAERLAQSEGLSGAVYAVQGFDTCSHITRMETNQGKMTYECNANSMITLVLGNDLLGQIMRAQEGR